MAGQGPVGFGPVAGNPQAEAATTNYALLVEDDDINIASATISGAGQWTPAELGLKLAAWFDASDSSTIVIENAKVSQWMNKVPGGVAVVQTDASRRPRYTENSAADRNLPAVYTDGTTYQYLQSVGASVPQGAEPSAMYAVASHTADNLNRIVLGMGTAANGPVGCIRALGTGGSGLGNVIYDDVGAGFHRDGNRAQVVGAGNISGIVYDGANDRFFTNGNVDNVIATVAATYDTNLWLFSLPLYPQATNNRSIQEVVMVRGTLTRDEGERLEGYLANKWALRGNLPAAHPYKSTAPLVTEKPWTPEELGGAVVGWWDAARADTVAISGGKVLGWSSRVGVMTATSLSTSLATYSTTAANSRPGVILPGQPVNAQDRAGSLQIEPVPASFPTGTSAGALVVLARHAVVTDGAYYQMPVGYGSEFNNQMRAIGATNTTSNVGVYGYSQDITTTVAWAAATTRSVYTDFSGGTVTATVDGQLTPLTAARAWDTGTAAFTIGGFAPTSSHWNGSIQEVMVLNRVLTTDERQKLEGYLQWKWGVQAQLPTAHPYRYAPPTALIGAAPASVTATGTSVEDDDVNVSSATISGAVANPKISELIDNFEDGVRDPAIWTTASPGSMVYPSTSSGGLAESGGRLLILPPSNGTGVRITGYVSANLYNMSNTSVFVAVPGVTTSNNETTLTAFSVGQSNAARYSAMKIGHKLYIRRRIGASEVTEAQFLYDTATHYWWRWRHQASGDAMCFDTAPITASNPPAPGDWVQRWAAEIDGVNPAAVRVSIEAGTQTATTGNGTAQFDGFNTAANSIPARDPSTTVYRGVRAQTAFYKGVRVTTQFYSGFRTF